MLSIGVMKTAGWEYYAREVADGLEDYYAGAGEAPGVWTGARRDRSRYHRHGVCARRWRSRSVRRAIPRPASRWVVRGGPMG